MNPEPEQGISRLPESLLHQNATGTETEVQVQHLPVVTTLPGGGGSASVPNWQQWSKEMLPLATLSSDPTNQKTKEKTKTKIYLSQNEINNKKQIFNVGPLCW